MNHNQYRIFPFIVVLFLVWACDSDSGSSGNPPTPQNPGAFEAELVGNQMVIRWRNLSLNNEGRKAVRDSIANQHHFDILKVDQCDCENTNLELWTLDTTDGAFIGIEGTLAQMDKSGESDVEGDVQFTFMVDSAGPFSNGSRKYNQLVGNASGDVVRIAVVDTGIEYDFLSNPVLYDNRNNSCQGQISGWDYNEGDGDPRDDHGHGTVVTQLIMDELDQKQVPYEIIPVRAFDEEGRGSYFDVLCSMNFISRYSAVKLVNFSFGWRGMEQNTIMNTLMDEMSQSVLFIASAGNEGIDTDLDEQAHFPSGYPAENLLSVAGYSGTPLKNDADHTVKEIQLHDQSNFGSLSIDLAAPFDDFIVNLNTYDQSRQYRENPAGTSYSSAFVTAKAAHMLFQRPNLTPIALKNEVIASGYACADFVDFSTSGKVLVADGN